MSSSPPATPVAHGRADANRAGPVGIVPLAPWSPSPSPSLSPSPVLTPAPVTGTLSADVTQFALPGADGNYGGTVNLSALGGPVTWHVIPSGPVVISGARSGLLAPGQPYAFAFSIDPAAQVNAGTAWIMFWPGDIRVEITWRALPVPSSSPVVTDTPSDTPSPLPS